MDDFKPLKEGVKWLRSPDATQENRFLAILKSRIRQKGLYRIAEGASSFASIGRQILVRFGLPKPVRESSMDFEKMKGPTLIAWALSAPDIHEILRPLKEAGYEVAEIDNGERISPSGQTFSWKYSYLMDPIFDQSPCVAPFFLEWVSPSAANTAPRGLELLELGAKHPTPEIFSKLFEALNFKMQVDLGTQPELLVQIKTAKGPAQLRIPRA